MMSNHSKVFWRAAISFGLAMTFFQVFQGHILVGLVGGVVGGAVAGGALAWITSISERNLARRGIVVTNMDPVQERSVEVQRSAAMAFEASRTALMHIPKARIVEENRETGELQARIGMTMRSFGETLTVQIVSCGDNCSKVSIRSVPRMKTTQADYGKGVENVEVFLRQLGSGVSTSVSSS
jgi:hypothetical protein